MTKLLVIKYFNINSVKQLFDFLPDKLSLNLSISSECVKFDLNGAEKLDGFQKSRKISLSSFFLYLWATFQEVEEILIYNHMIN